MTIGLRIISQGYVRVQVRRKRTGVDSGREKEHSLVAEKVLGKSLPPKAVVHHVNGDGTDNRNENLVICQDQGYHNLIHQRMRSYEACGHASWLKCTYCKVYDAPENLEHCRVPGNRVQHYHRECYNLLQRKWRIERRKQRMDLFS